MNKQDYVPRTLDSRIVKDGLRAVSLLNRLSQNGGVYIVVGGMAVQGYLPSSYRRPTSDIDISVLRPLNYEDFKLFSKDMREYLQDNNYLTETKKKNNSFCINIIPKNDHPIVIEFSRRNSRKFEIERSRLEKEVENARIKELETGESYFVSSPEDIAAPKIVRGIGSVKRNPELIEEASLFDTVHPEEIPVILENISFLRGQAKGEGNLAIKEKARLISDLYDIKMLSGTVGFNQKYMQEVISRWDALKEPSAEKASLIRFLLNN